MRARVHAPQKGWVRFLALADERGERESYALIASEGSELNPLAAGHTGAVADAAKNQTTKSATTSPTIAAISGTP
jgi:hypothetical protein